MPAHYILTCSCTSLHFTKRAYRINNKKRTYLWPKVDFSTFQSNPFSQNELPFDDAAYATDDVLRHIMWDCSSWSTWVLSNYFLSIDQLYLCCRVCLTLFVVTLFSAVTRQQKTWDSSRKIWGMRALVAHTHTHNTLTQNTHTHNITSATLTNAIL